MSTEKPRCDDTGLARLACVTTSVSPVRRIARFVRRTTGLGATRHEVLVLRSEIVQMREQLDRIDRIVQTLNHDVRSGAPESLPLFLGYAERLRLDAETAAGVAQVIERQLTRLEDRLGPLPEK